MFIMFQYILLYIFCFNFVILPLCEFYNNLLLDYSSIFNDFCKIFYKTALKKTNADMLSMLPIKVNKFVDGVICKQAYVHSNNRE